MSPKHGLGIPSLTCVYAYEYRLCFVLYIYWGLITTRDASYGHKQELDLSSNSANLIFDRLKFPNKFSNQEQPNLVFVITAEMYAYRQGLSTTYIVRTCQMLW